MNDELKLYNVSAVARYLSDTQEEEESLVMSGASV